MNVKSGDVTGVSPDPDTVFIPTKPVASDTSMADLELRHMEDGRLAVLAYTSLDLLVAGCGTQQSWIASPVGELETLQQLAGFDVIALNVELPDDWRVSGGDTTTATASEVETR